MNALLSLLESIQQQSQQLFACLEEEKQALDDNQLELLEDISQQKQTLLLQLNTLDEQRTTHSPANDFNIFIANSNDQALIKQWSVTREHITQCQQQNEINGRIIEKRSRINQDILSLLSGKEQQEVATYDADGNQSKSTSLLNGIKA